ncbi:MAG TPA: hypothetical protein VIM51_10920 [Desulfosporosinus sp.]
MRKLTLQFLNSYLDSGTKTSKPLNQAIFEFLKNYDSKVVEDLPAEFINVHDSQISEIIEKSGLDVGLNILQGIEQGDRAIEAYGPLESIRFEFISVDGSCVESMSPERLRKVYEEFEWKAKICPVLHYPNYNLYNMNNNFTLDWFVPIPINTSCFSDEQKKKIQKNILNHFEKYFNAEAKLVWWSVLSQPEIRGVEYLYDEIIFREIYYNSFGLELDYKLKDQKVE